ncbi:MAG: hypothetical protein WCQ57_02865 [Verrucomicrobiota bacterium]
MRPLYYVKSPDEPFRNQLHGRNPRQWFRSIEEAKVLAEQLASRMTPMQPVQCLVEVSWQNGQEFHAVIADYQSGHEWRTKWDAGPNAGSFLNWELLPPPADTQKESVRCPRCLKSFPLSQHL